MLKLTLDHMCIVKPPLLVSYNADGTEGNPVSYDYSENIYGEVV